MAKTRKKKRKKTGKIWIFIGTLMITVSLGCLILLLGWLFSSGRNLEIAAVNVQEEVLSQRTQEDGTVASLSGDAGEEDSGLTGRYDDILADPGKMRQENIYGKTPAVPGEVTLAFAGDILFDDSYSIMVKMKNRGKGIEGSISEELLGHMREADLFMVNNEFTYTSRGTPTEGKTYTFRADPAHVSLLWDMGADIVSLANNHSYDYGQISLTDTLDTLEGIGMPYVGAGRNLEEAARPVYYIVGDYKIAFLSATQIERVDHPDTKGATETSPGVFRCRDVEPLLEAVRQAKQESDFVVVYVHWGTESTDQLDWAQKEQAPKIAEAGANLIIGDHPHVLQGIEYFGSTPVIYSLGNFLFNSRTLDTCLVKVTLGEEGIKSFQFLPVLQSDCAASLLSGSGKERVLSYMRSISPGVTIDGEGYVTH